MLAVPGQSTLSVSTRSPSSTQLTSRLRVFDTTTGHGSSCVSLACMRRYHQGLVKTQSCQSSSRRRSMQQHQQKTVTASRRMPKTPSGEIVAGRTRALRRAPTFLQVPQAQARDHASLRTAPLSTETSDAAQAVLPPCHTVSPCHRLGSSKRRGYARVYHPQSR